MDETQGPWKAVGRLCRTFQREASVHAVCAGFAHVIQTYNLKPVNKQQTPKSAKIPGFEALHEKTQLQKQQGSKQLSNLVIYMPV